MSKRTSRLSGFYQKSIAERVAIVADWAALDEEEVAVLHESLSVSRADKMSENVIGRYSLPLGIGANFTINGRDYLAPMAIEEPSVVAAVSYAAKLARTGGGFHTGSTRSIMIGQIQLLDVADFDAAREAILAEKDALLEIADTSPTIARLGGGPTDLEIYAFPETPTGPMLVVHLLFDTLNAMGANAVNTAAEAIAPALERLSGGRALLRILSNLTDRRRAWAEVMIPAVSFSSISYSGEEIVRNIAHANALAVVDPYRAATHNKGILNGIDAVVLATGNDWRALEAGAHAYAARNGQYRALTEWRVIDDEDELRLKIEEWGLGDSEIGRDSEIGGDLEIGGDSEIGRLANRDSSSPNPNLPISQSPNPQSPPYLYGRLELPVAVGVVGGATRAHPAAQVALKILGVKTARELAEVMAAVGLAQNLAAIRALATEGIQQGHMSLHARQVAIAAGATGVEIDRIAAQLVREDAVRVERAQEILGRRA